jgi:hypothetical protein
MRPRYCSDLFQIFHPFLTKFIGEFGVIGNLKRKVTRTIANPELSTITAGGDMPPSCALCSRFCLYSDSTPSSAVSKAPVFAFTVIKFK